MDNIFKVRRLAWSLLIAAAFIGGCGEAGSPTGPAQGEAPVVTGISPATGSTGGGASMRIVGTKFRTGAFAIFDGVTVRGRLDTALTTLFVETPPHPEGVIDIEVSNADGASTRVVGGHIYVPPSSFDLNGAWAGFQGNGDDRGISFTVENGRLVRASCDNASFAGVSIPLESAVPVSNGEFSVYAGERVVLSGRIVSATETTGKMDFDTCSTVWRATRLKSAMSAR